MCSVIKPAMMTFISLSHTYSANITQLTHCQLFYGVFTDSLECREEESVETMEKDIGVQL